MLLSCAEQIIMMDQKTYSKPTIRTTKIIETLLFEFSLGFSLIGASRNS
jgi:hypothetical protein